MYKTQSEASEFLMEFISQIDDAPENREVVLCVPFTDLTIVNKSLHGNRIRLGAQNVHWEDCGAYTGEISASMLTEMGVRYVIIGHSERRQYFGETDETVNLRLKAAQSNGLIPILCVGETKLQRDAGETEQKIDLQLERDLVGIDQTKLVIAYEPIWAIGTGLACEPTQANGVASILRRTLTEIFGQETAQAIRIQYGGSVNSKNIADFMAQPEIDGALVCGASLDAAEFVRIVARTQEVYARRGR